jgi:putative transposase
MKLYPNQLFHIYNRGNNRRKVFFERENYLFFLQKMREMLLPKKIEMLAYCLMPNHFHLMISTQDDFEHQDFSNAFRVLLSSYTRAINKRYDWVGSVFQQNSKAKALENGIYAQTCFHYIHQNPMKADLVQKIEDWEFSSYRDYAGLRNGTLCQQSITRLLLDLPNDPENFINLSQKVIDPQLLEEIW